MRERVASEKILPLIGIFDVFSAALASKKFEAIFCSGYGFAASYYGLPDEGYIAWTDMVAYVERIRAVLPETHIVVDIDDGYGDPNIAANITRRLERVGASAIILEDQRRPKRCGHLPGKEILSLEEYMPRLEAVLATREKLYVIARTDTTDIEEAIFRCQKFIQAGVDGVLVEGLSDIEQIKKIRKAIGKDVSITINLIAGGKTPPVTLTELQKLGTNLVNYSTPCLFSSQAAINATLDKLIKSDGELAYEKGDIGLEQNNSVLKNMLASALGK
jgi:2-methylisocitrate lyase-like PEP mutase family enzyme